MLIDEHDARQVWSGTYVVIGKSPYFVESIRGKRVMVRCLVTGEVSSIAPDTDVIRPYPHRKYGYLPYSSETPARSSAYIHRTQNRQYRIGMVLPRETDDKVVLAMFRGRYPKFSDAQRRSQAGRTIAFHRDFAIRGGTAIFYRDTGIVLIQQDGSLQWVNRKTKDLMEAYLKELMAK